MSAAVVGNKVKIHYTGTFDNGEVFDSSRETEPLEFEIGTGEVIPGFDAAVVGMKIGESKKVRLLEDEAYGPYNQEMVFEAQPGQFEEGLVPEEGQQFQTQLEDETPLLLTVKSVDGDKVVLDANHPMAGKTLNFDLEVVEIT
ncbi:MAG: peptidylprolyl isomerase [Deltaproteobacteria bacterium]|nr:MAG: peptidylprolyl isomerase [Deltaproteobacteria bacterium]